MAIREKRFIIIGAGDVGSSLAHLLAAHTHEVILIESDANKIRGKSSEFDYHLLHGNGCSPDILLAAGVHEADYVVAVTNIDEVNIAACLSAKLLNPDARRVARIRDIDFTDERIPLERLSQFFDLIIKPSEAAAEKLLAVFDAPGARDIVDFADGQIRAISLEVAEGSVLADKKLSALQEIQEKFRCLVIAIIRGNSLIVPRGSDRVRPGDIVYLMARPKNTAKLFELAGQTMKKFKHAMIWGGSGLGRILARDLERRGISVKLVLSDEGLATLASEDLSSTLVLKGECTDERFLLEENIAEMDSFIGASASEEDNVLATLLAKRLGAGTCMALVNKADYLKVVSAVGVDVVVSSRHAAASAIFRHIHSRSVVSEFMLTDHEASFLELRAREGMRLLGTPFKDIKFPYGIIVAAILRQGEVLIPAGDSTISIGDRLIIFVTKKAAPELEKLIDMDIELFA